MQFPLGRSDVNIKPLTLWRPALPMGTALQEGEGEQFDAGSGEGSGAKPLERGGPYPQVGS